MCDVRTLTYCLLGLLAAAGTSASAQDVLQVGQTLTKEGRITVPEQGGDAAVEHVVRLPAGTRIRAAANSADMDPVIEVARPCNREAEPQCQHEVIAADDDSGEGFNALATFAILEEGPYIFRVRSLSSGGGSYSLEIGTLPPLPEARAVDGPQVRMMFTMLDGDLTADDPQSGGRHFEDFRLELVAGQEILIRFRSDDFDPTVAVLRHSDRDGVQIAFSDDLRMAPGAMLLFRATSAGDYVVRATSGAPGQTGKFRIWIGRVVR